jgi:hypothetical protein
MFLERLEPRVRDAAQGTRTLSIADGVEIPAAAFKPVPTNSINLRGRTLEVSGFVFISHIAAHVGSHSLSWRHSSPTNYEFGFGRFERPLESLSKRQISSHGKTLLGVPLDLCAVACFIARMLPLIGLFISSAKAHPELTPNPEREPHEIQASA